MRHPSFGSDASLTVDLPAEITLVYGIMFDSHGAELPERDDFIEMSYRWLDRNGVEDMQEALKAWIDSPLTVMEVQPRAEMPLPDIQSVLTTGLSEDEEIRFVEATHGVMLFVTEMPRPPHIGTHAAHAVAFGIAQAMNGVVYNPSINGIVPLKMYDRPIPEFGRLIMKEHIVMPASIDSSGMGMIKTIGMRNLGLPEFYLGDIPRELLPRIGSVVAGVADRLYIKCMGQALDSPIGPIAVKIENAELNIKLTNIAKASGKFDAETPEGVQGWTNILLAYEGDDQFSGTPFLEILPPRGVTSPRSVWYYSMLEELLGRASEVKLIKSGSELLEIAHIQAMDELPAMKQRYLAGLQPGEVFAIKKGFPMPSGDNEYMWVTIISWEDNTLLGILSSEPQSVPDLRAGQSLQFEEEEIFDWTLRQADGTTLGNYTKKALLRDGLS